MSIEVNESRLVDLQCIDAYHLLCISNPSPWHSSLILRSSFSASTKADRISWLLCAFVASHSPSSLYRWVSVVVALCGDMSQRCSVQWYTSDPKFRLYDSRMSEADPLLQRRTSRSIRLKELELPVDGEQSLSRLSDSRFAE